MIAHLRRVDLRHVGSGNIGATNAARALGKGLGLLVLLLDAGKAYLPAILCLRYGSAVELPPPPWEMWTAAAVVAAAFFGHLYPIFAGFAGGKGVATAFGGFLALEPRAALLSALIYAVAYGVTRISSVGSLLGVLSFPVGLYLTGARLTGPRLPSYVLTAVLLVFILVRHRGNIQRLLQHKEQRV